MANPFESALTGKPDPREYCISTKDFVIDDEGKLSGLNTVRVEWTKDSGGRWKMEEVPGSQKFFKAQLVFLALGFLGPQQEPLKNLGVKLDGRGNVQTPPRVSIRLIERSCSATDPFLLFSPEIFHQS